MCKSVTDRGKGGKALSLIGRERMIRRPRGERYADLEQPAAGEEELGDEEMKTYSVESAERKLGSKTSLVELTGRFVSSDSFGLPAPQRENWRQIKMRESAIFP